jgi:1-aminocyclopropane-1-carboxylate deaminase/D-cysteine desulfhydrase-like pyridoxal-dependent ACC family enzyme
MADAFGRLDALPRAVLASDPTPLERLENLEREIAGSQGGPRLYVKRDDTQSIAFGGNKVRQLELYFGAARAEAADTVLITGAVQSNFCRTCAAFAAKLDMECHIQQEERVATNDPLYRESGNVLVERLLGAVLHSYPHGEDEAGADARLEEIAEELRRRGRKPYVIHLAPGHPPLGALGYVLAARELTDQLDAAGIEPTGYVVPSGSGATHAGLLYGLWALGREAPVLGICVRRSAELQAPRVRGRCGEIAALLGAVNPVSDADVQVTDAFLAPGYGHLNAATREAILTGAAREALMLDPVYSGKAMAGFLDWARNASAGETLVFLHTGGTPGIFAYGSALTANPGSTAETVKGLA